ncbi:hypothetical protein PENTCL1PPCAC_28750, partial [Pristionchus entomophagus]
LSAERPAESDEISSAEFLQELPIVLSDEEMCGICHEPLSLMRSVNLRPCKHAYHRSCILKWFEVRVSLELHTCCICRTVASEVTGEDGKPVIRTYPLQIVQEGLTRCPKNVDHAKLLSAASCSTHKIIIILEELAHQKRVALRE